ncbi:MAG: hypothetical protein U0136_11110 [Bdellovibrionota bacterium]
MHRRCRATGRDFVVTEPELAHIEKMGRTHPSIAEPLPPPTLHPHELLNQLYSFGNLIYLYPGKSALSGASQLSRYNPADGYRICTLDEFWSDKVDNADFGAAYDFTRPFFEQWHALSKRVYLSPLNNRNVENSDYVNGTLNVRNCYLCFDSVESQDCLYCFVHLNGTDNLDCVGTIDSELCYNCVDVAKCYECDHCQDCISSSFCFGCLDCVGCNHCFGSVGARNAEYLVFNQQVSKAEYESFVASAMLDDYGSRTAELERCRKFHRSTGHAVQRVRNSEDCTGAYIQNSKNLFECYHADNSRDCGYLLLGYNSHDCWRGYCWNGELSYQSGSVGASRSYYSYSDFSGENNLYCYLMFNRNANCFGCIGLRSKSYCILNKQYTEAEYFELLPRIIRHMKATKEWGEFFPPSIAPHPYNESISPLYFEPNDPERLKVRGYRFSPEQAFTSYPGALLATALPNSASGAAAKELLKKPVLCAKTGRPFNFQAKELQFYERRRIPLPRLHWRERLFDMLGSRALLPAL